MSDVVCIRIHFTAFLMNNSDRCERISIRLAVLAVSFHYCIGHSRAFAPKSSFVLSNWSGQNLNYDINVEFDAKIDNILTAKFNTIGGSKRFWHAVTLSCVELIERQFLPGVHLIGKTTLSLIIKGSRYIVKYEFMHDFRATGSDRSMDWWRIFHVFPNFAYAMGDSHSSCEVVLATQNKRCWGSGWVTAWTVFRPFPISKGKPI